MVRMKERKEQTKKSRNAEQEGFQINYKQTKGKGESMQERGGEGKGRGGKGQGRIIC